MPKTSCYNNWDRFARVGVEPPALLVCLILLKYLFITSKFRIRSFHSCIITLYHVIGKGYKWLLEKSYKNVSVARTSLLVNCIDKKILIFWPPGDITVNSLGSP